MLRRKHFQEGSAELQIPSLRFATVGMTKGRVALSREGWFVAEKNSTRLDYATFCRKKHFQEGSAEPQIPPLRFATVGMTKGRVALPVWIRLWLGNRLQRSGGTCCLFFDLPAEAVLP
jgi:hypothetical protein